MIGDKEIDLIVGGPPCQGMSLSGPRKFDDPRNSLYLSYIRLVDQIRPKAFVIENVPGLVSLFGGQIKDNIISRFTEMGYKIGMKDHEFKFPEPYDYKVTCGMAISDLPPLVNELGSSSMTYPMEPTNQYQALMRKGSDTIHNHIAAAHMG